MDDGVGFLPHERHHGDRHEGEDQQCRHCHDEAYPFFICKSSHGHLTGPSALGRKPGRSPYRLAALLQGQHHQDPPHIGGGGRPLFGHRLFQNPGGSQYLCLGRQASNEACVAPPEASGERRGSGKLIVQWRPRTGLCLVASGGCPSRLKAFQLTPQGIAVSRHHRG